MNRIYLVRHGENHANLTKEFSHRRVDYPLTPKGVLQAQQTALYFVGRPIAGVLSSPLKRAMQTAEIIAGPLGLPVIVAEEFREVDVGVLEDQPPTQENWERHNAIIGCWWDGNVEISFPGGENKIALLERARAGYERILRLFPYQETVLVGHGGIFTFTIADLCPNADPALLRNAENHNCSISEVLFRFEEGRLNGELKSWASTAHLSGQAADLVSGVPQPGELSRKSDPHERPAN